MSDRPVLVIPIHADRVALQQSLSVLVSHGIRHEVSRNPHQAVLSATQDRPVLALVHGGDADMPLIRTVEKVAQATNMRLPILVLAERLNETDEYRLLSCGARDVLSLPLSPTRLRVRVLAMRRSAMGDATAVNRYSRGSLDIDVGRREVHIDGHEIYLTRSEFDLLAALARDPRRVVTRDELSSTIGRPGNGKAVESHLSRLRKKVNIEAESRLIEPVRGVGYRLGVAYPEQRVG